MRPQYRSTALSVVDLPFQILVVCTGNVCRSPAIERLLAATLDASVQVTSAGTFALRGQPISPPMDELIERAGGSASNFAARQLTPAVIAAAGLVLTATREHRSAVVEMVPGAVRRTFTLREFARLLTRVDTGLLPEGPAAARLATAVPHALAERGTVRTTAGEDAVVDPYGRSAEVYAQAFEVIRLAVETIGETAAGRAPQSSNPSLGEGKAGRE